MHGLRVGKAGKLGRGVFATHKFDAWDLIEYAPLLVIEDHLESYVVEQHTMLGNYCYEHSCDQICIALGYASLYNHSTRPNAVYKVFQDHIEIHALQKIKPGTQIKVNYNGDPRDKTPINFEDR